MLQYEFIYPVELDSYVTGSITYYTTKYSTNNQSKHLQPLVRLFLP